MLDFLSKLISPLTTILSPAKTEWATYLDYKQNQTNTPPKLTAEALRIYEAVFKALRNYKIDPSTVTVIVRPKQETKDGGYCNSITRTVCIDETLAESGKSDEVLNYCIYHEIGHLADRGLQKIDEARIKAGDQWNKEKELECLRQGELRADFLATKNLIDACQYTPILYRLIVLLEHIAEGTTRDDETHPTCYEEYTNIAQYFVDHNYKIDFSYSSQSDCIKTIIIITNSNLPTLEVTGEYPRKLIEPTDLIASRFLSQTRLSTKILSQATMPNDIMKTEEMKESVNKPNSKNSYAALALAHRFIFGGSQ